ncbi:MAG: diacylglycerol/lipid kinase family protein [Nanoarchaeota archaeon]
MKVLCIVNPAAGRPKPILDSLNTFLSDQNITFDILVTGTGAVVPPMPYDYSIIYGGDGTVTEYLAKLKMPVLVLHGGTANVIAKSLRIPKDVCEALRLLTEGRVELFDSFTVNRRPAFLRAHTWAGVHMRPDKDSKRRSGIAAYLRTFLKGPSVQEQEYLVYVDGSKRKLRSNLMLVANFPHLGLANIRLDSRIDARDAKLDMLYDLDPLRLSKKHAAFEHLTVVTSRKQPWAIDDKVHYYKRVRFKIVPRSVQLVVPCA